MRKLALSLSSLLLVVGIVSTAVAQSSQPAPGNAPAPSATQNPPAATPGGSDSAEKDVAKPSDAQPSVMPNVKIDNRTEIKRDASSEGSALPRSATERPTVLGLSPTVAAVLGAALLVVVIVALVAMSKNSRDHIDVLPPRV